MGSMGGGQEMIHSQGLLSYNSATLLPSVPAPIRGVSTQQLSHNPTSEKKKKEKNIYLLRGRIKSVTAIVQL